MITEHHEISSDHSIQVHDFDTVQTLESEPAHHDGDHLPGVD